MRTVFLSSTARDLGKYCAELARAINALPGWHCVWMEDFYASNTTSIEHCQKRVNECDVYVGVIGPLHGSCPTGSKISFTEHEYEAAEAKDMPRLIFLIGDNFLVANRLFEPSTKQKAQRKFRQRLTKERMVKLFDDPEKLNGLVIGSLISLSEEGKSAAMIAHSSHAQGDGVPERQQQTETIPSPLTSFIGREQEQKILRDLLQKKKLLTITGPPGAGKTRVAIELARSVRADFDWVWFVELSQLQEADLVPQRVATVLGIREQAFRPPTEALADFLKSGKYVLVLDNCEHLIGACAHLATYLLQRCPELKIVTTSRTILNVAGEQLFAMPPLVLPDPKRLPKLAKLALIDSVQLLLERAQTRLNVKLTAENASAVVALCRGLEGIPLAIELAAAQLDTLTVDEIVVRLNRQLDLLVGGAGGEVERQWATLNEAIKLSYEMLDDKQRMLFRRLSAFHRGWTLEAAAAICREGQQDEFAIRTLLNQLYRRSLLVCEEANGRKRFRLLDSIREYAKGKLVEAAEESDVAKRHAKWFVELAEKAAPELLKKEQTQWLDALTAEADNKRAVVLWALQNREVEVALRLTTSLWRLTEIRGYYCEGVDRLKRVLDMPESATHPALRSKALSGLGMLFYRQGDITTAEAYFSKSLDIERDQNNQPGIANALNDLGNVAHMKGDFQLARTHFNESLEIERKTENARGIAVALYNLGKNARKLGMTEEAAVLLHDSRESFEAEGNLREAAFPLNALAWLAVDRHDFGAALDYVARSLEIRKECGDKKGIADSRRALGAILMQQGDLRLAYKEISESAELARGLDDKLGIAESFEQFAALAAIEKDFASCIALNSTAEKLRCEMQIPLAPIERFVRESQLATIRGSLGEQVFLKSWEAGRRSSIAEALEMVGRLQAHAAGPLTDTIYARGHKDMRNSQMEHRRRSVLPPEKTALPHFA